MASYCEAAHTPQHPEFRLADISKRSRYGWEDGQLALTAPGATFYPLGEYAIYAQQTEPIGILGGELSRWDTEHTTVMVREHHPAGLRILCDSVEAQKQVKIYAPDATVEMDYNPGFIADLRRLKIWRPMDLTKTNNPPTPVKNAWGDRSVRDNGNLSEYFEKGWPWELVLKAAEVARVTLWLNIPATYTEYDITQLASLCNLYDVPLMVELSNEHWNSRFSQYMSSDRHGRLCEAVWNVFDTHYGTDYTRVLCGQGTAPRVMERALAHCNPDALAIAAYFNPGKEGAFSNRNNLEQLCYTSIDNRVPLWKEHFQYGLPVFGYEGGSHVAAAPGEERTDRDYVALCTEFNRHPAIAGVYQHLINAWKELGGEEICWFQRVGYAGAAGLWGHKESNDAVAAPKWKATINTTFSSEKEPEVPDSTNLILNLPDGGVPTDTQAGGVAGWSGPATRYGDRDEIVIPLDTPLSTPFTVEFDFRRNQLGDGNIPTNPVGMCEAIGFYNDDSIEPLQLGLSAHCDVGEPELRAVRARCFRKRYAYDEEGNPVRNDKGHHVISTDLIQNGSSPAAENIVWEPGAWHRASMIFHPTHEHRILQARLDDHHKSVQGLEPREDLGPTVSFKYIVLGRCFRRDSQTMDLANIRITKGVIPPITLLENAKKAGLGYLSSREELVVSGRIEQDNPDPTPEPDIEIVGTETGTYQKQLLADGTTRLILSPASDSQSVPGFKGTGVYPIGTLVRAVDLADGKNYQVTELVKVTEATP